MRTIDTRGYLSALCELTDQGNTASTVVTGGSMEPFLSSNRDYVCLEKPHRELHRGDVVLFRRRNGDYVLHRIRYIRDTGYFLVGDRQTETEGPVQREQILAIVTEVKHNGKWITQSALRWKFYSKVWINIVPLRPAIFKLCGILRRKKKGGKQK